MMISKHIDILNEKNKQKSHERVTCNDYYNRTMDMFYEIYWIHMLLKIKLCENPTESLSYMWLFSPYCGSK